MKNYKKYKLVKYKKPAIALGITASIIFSFPVGFIAKSIHDNPSNSNTSSYYSDNSSQTTTYVDSNDDYVKVETSDEKEIITCEKFSTKIILDKLSYDNIMNTLDNDNYNFSMSKYYELNNVLKEYYNCQSYKNESSNIISNGMLDSGKLYDVVITNNNEYMKQDKNSVNIFFSETSDSNIKNICNLIAETYNNNKKDYSDIKKISDTLMHLKIFQNNTTSSNAYVNDDLVFVFNPNMIELFSNMQDIRGNSNDGVNIDKTIFVHEIEHLFQNASNDFVDENGIEVGFCRKYYDVNVNSLWNSWLLEGSAEIKMAKSLNTTPKNYDKKISYIRTYNLSRIFEDEYDIENLVNSTFIDDLNDVFKLLNINNDTDKKEFLELMYSIEITQSDVEDFWDFYQKKENITLTDEEKSSLRMNIRTEVIKNISKKYYTGLANSLLSGRVNDLETLFYFMRLWELDCCGHLDFTNENGYEHSKEFILWQDNVERSFIKAISNNIDISYENLIEKYNDYHMVINYNEKEVNNSDFSKFTSEKQEYIVSSYESYSVTHFARTSTMVNYINNELNKENVNVKN